MKYKQVGKKVIIRIDKGEEIIESLKTICTKLNIRLGTITGIGATNKVVIGLLDVKTMKYHSKEVTGDHEIAPICGNITTMNGDVYLHLHINVCNAEHHSFGGHCTAAVVSVTFEGVIDIIDDTVERVFDKNTGINLLDIP